jgi:hypothetical protein
MTASKEDAISNTRQELTNGGVTGGSDMTSITVIHGFETANACMVPVSLTEGDMQAVMIHGLETANACVAPVSLTEGEMQALSNRVLPGWVEECLRAETIRGDDRVNASDI